MKKEVNKLKIVVIIIGIIFAIGLIFGIATIYKFCTLQSILSKVDKNIEKDNYYVETTFKYYGMQTVTKAYYKDSVGKLLSPNGIYTWTNEKNAYMIDETEKKAYVLNMDNNSELVSSNMFAYLYPGYNKTAFQRFALMGNVSNSIWSEKVNDESCYKISIENRKENTKTTYWITKKDGKLVKATFEFPNGEVFEYEYNIKFNVVSLTDIDLPLLSEYEVITEGTENLQLENTENIENTETTEPN